MVSLVIRLYCDTAVPNPSLAHRALTAAPERGLLLLCNVTVAQMDDGRNEIERGPTLVYMDVVFHVYRGERTQPPLAD